MEDTATKIERSEKDFISLIKHFYFTYRLVSSIFVFMSLLILLSAIIVSVLLLYPYQYRFQFYPHFSMKETGMQADPVNMIFVGSKEQIEQGFKDAGWQVADPITPGSYTRIVFDGLIHLSYQNAPVSNLYIDGRIQDIAFEKETTNVLYRQHIRLWQVNGAFQGKSIWVGAASFDNGIEISATTHLPTHHIFPTIDSQRDAIGIDMLQARAPVVEKLVPFNAPIISGKNGDGDFYETDGNVLVVSFEPIPSELDASNGFVFNVKNWIFNMYADSLNFFLDVNNDALGIPLHSIGDFWMKRYLYACPNILFCY